MLEASTPCLDLVYKPARPAGLVHAVLVECPFVVVQQHVFVGNAGALDGEASVGRVCHVGGVLPGEACPADLDGNARNVDIARGAVDSSQNAGLGYTWKDWECM